MKALILDSEKRFLLALESKGSWDLPGGGLDYGEEPHACLAREIKEEMSLEVLHASKHPSYFFSSPQRNRDYWICNALYEVKVKDLDFQPSDECVEVRFFTKEEALKEDLFPNVKEFIKVYDPDNHGLAKPL